MDAHASFGFPMTSMPTSPIYQHLQGVMFYLPVCLPNPDFNRSFFLCVHTKFGLSNLGRLKSLGFEVQNLFHNDCAENEDIMVFI